MKTETERTCPLLIHGVPKKIKAQFKSKVAKQEETMKDILIKFMKEYVNNSN